METRVKYVRRDLSGGYDTSPEGTIAIQLPSKNSLTRMLVRHISLMRIKLGIAKLKEGENFNKKEGRKLALERMKDSLLQLYSVNIDMEKEGRMIYTFITDSPTLIGSTLYNTRLLLSTYKDSEQCRLLSAEILEDYGWREVEDNDE